MNTDLLKELGLDTAANKIDKGQDLKRKLAIAYEHYRFVSPEIFNRFQNQLYEKTQKIQKNCPKCDGTLIVKKNEDNGFFTSFKKGQKCNYCSGTGAEEMTYDKLAFVKIEEYPEVPPPDCLMDLKKAKDMRCFDRFEVAKVETVEVRPDPIIFGLIDNCVDKFFVTQWDDDIRIEDILKDSEG